MISRLSAAAEEQQDALRPHQHTETDRNSLPGHGVRVVKVASIRGKRLRGKVHKVRELRKIICRLVEADVAGVADAEDLQIGRVGAAECFIAAALGLRVGCIALRDRRVLRRDAAGAEEMLLQIVTIGLRMRAGETGIFIRVDRADAGKAPAPPPGGGGPARGTCPRASCPVTVPRQVSGFCLICASTISAAQQLRVS